MRASDVFFRLFSRKKRIQSQKKILSEIRRSLFELRPLFVKSGGSDGESLRANALSAGMNRQIDAIAARVFAERALALLLDAVDLVSEIEVYARRLSPARDYALYMLDSQTNAAANAVRTARSLGAEEGFLRQKLAFAVRLLWSMCHDSGQTDLRMFSEEIECDFPFAGELTRIAARCQKRWKHEHRLE